MPAAFGAEEREDRSWRKAVIREVDAVLRKGGTPDADALARRWLGEADQIRAIVEVRKSLLEEGILDEAAEDEDEEIAGGDEDRDRALADLKSEFQDAINRGDALDAVAVVGQRPELRDDVADLSHFYDFIAEALKPEFAWPAPDPVQEVVLSHFRLVTMHARHPLGGLFLGVDTHTNRHVEVLVIRGQMSKARSNRLVRDALLVREIADPGLVPVLDAGEVNDLRFVAWDYRSELTVDRVIRRLRRAGGRRALFEVLEAHSDAGKQTGDPKAPSEDLPIDVPEDSASRLLANPAHVASVLQLVATAAEALDRAHLRGFVMADVRPANVFVDRDGHPRLRGLALVQHARAAWHRLGAEVTHLAPEVLADDEPALDWRVDVYGVAVLAYALLSLKDPPDFGTLPQRPERLFLDLRGAPEALVPLLDRALDSDPTERPASCGLMARELRRMAESLRPTGPVLPQASPPVPAWVWYGFLTLVLVGVLTWLLLSVM